MNKEEIMLLKIIVYNELENLSNKMEQSKSKIEEYSKWKNLYNKYSVILDKLG